MREESERPAKIGQATALNLANLVSVSRILLLPFFFLAVVYHRPGLGLALLVVAGITDLLDGYIARRFDLTTTFGEYLDPATDKLLAAVGFIVLTIDLGYPNQAPVWLTSLILARDTLIAVVALCMYLAGRRRRFPATTLGKIHSTAVVLTIGLFLLHNTLGTSTILIPLAVWTTLCTTLASGFHYAWLVTLPAGEELRDDAEREMGTAGE